MTPKQRGDTRRRQKRKSPVGVGGASDSRCISSLQRAQLSKALERVWSWRVCESGNSRPRTLAYSPRQVKPASRPVRQTRGPSQKSGLQPYTRREQDLHCSSDLNSNDEARGSDQKRRARAQARPPRKGAWRRFGASEAAESMLEDQRQRLKALGVGREETMRALNDVRAELKRVSQERDELRHKLTRVDSVQTATIALPDDDPARRRRPPTCRRSRTSWARSARSRAQATVASPGICISACSTPRRTRRR